MDENMPKVASIQTIRRLPAYLALLRKVLAEGREVISSATIGEMLQLDAVQVRKDLAITGTEGKPKVGYSVAELISAIESFLGWDNTKEAFIAGAGNLGKALMGYSGFARHGMKIIAAFDEDDAIAGRKVSGIDVLPVGKLSELAFRMGIRIGIIAVPADSAQQICDAMCEGGIRAIWNFAPVKLKTPPEVIVQDEDLAAGLAVLSYKLGKTEKGELS